VLGFVDANIFEPVQDPLDGDSALDPGERPAGQLCAPRAKATFWRGSIVNISSVEGLAGSPHLHSYVAAKFGLRGITKSAAVELAQYNIRVNSIHPGLVHTPLSQGVTEEFMQPIPMRRGASPAEISTFVLFLVSDESAYATGAEFVVDGGLTSYVPAKILMLGESPYSYQGLMSREPVRP
jgi:3alpha(or 20beta)-hydroxysteroid dehydrogenase